MYGLYSPKKKCLMEFSTCANNGADFCNPVEFELNEFYPQGLLWVTHKINVAEKICEKGSTPWYNSGYESPTWDEEYYGQLIVVDLELAEYKKLLQ